MLQALFEKHNSFLRPLKKKDFQEQRVTTIGLYDIGKSHDPGIQQEPGEKMGSIARVMIDKRSGQVASAVLSFGGFLGIGNDYYPIPWAALSYDTSLGGYRTNIT